MYSHVSQGALLQRINSLLADQHVMLRKTKHGKKWQDTLGAFYLIDFDRNIIVERNVDIVQKAKELGVIN
jgi:hypothetical protein